MVRPAVALAHVPVRRFRPNLASVLRRVRTDGAYVVLTRRGVPIAALVPLGVLDILEAADGLLAGRLQAASEHLHDVATAVPDVAPRSGCATASPRRSRRPPVPRRE